MTRHSNARRYQGGDCLFLTACEIASVPPTYRQYRKWVTNRGIAYSVRDQAQQRINPHQKQA